MKATLLVFKSGASVTVYHKEDEDLTYAVSVNRENVDLQLDVTENTKNEAKWLAEHKQHIKENSVNRAKIQVESEIESRQFAQKAVDSTKSKLTQARIVT